jgi:hypothetical protein
MAGAGTQVAVEGGLTTRNVRLLPLSLARDRRRRGALEEVFL